MAVVADGRAAVTHYQILERFPAYTLLAVRLETGRTHQIRVHLSHHAPSPGGRSGLRRAPAPAQGCLPALIAALQAFPRQALHAIRLGLDHPLSGEPMAWEVPLAADIEALLALLRAESGGPARPGGV